MARQCRLALLFFGILALSACSLAPRQASTESGLSEARSDRQWQSHQTELQAFTQWTLIGKIGIRAARESNTAHINWRQQNEYFKINLSGPFGQGAAQLSGTFESVLLKIAGQQELRTNQPEAVLLQQTGWDIPIKTLLYWIKGIPSPDQKASFELDAEGRLSRLTQAQWRLEYTGYQQLESLWLPKKIQLYRDRVKLTLVIKGWGHPSVTTG